MRNLSTGHGSRRSKNRKRTATDLRQGQTI